MVQSLGSRERLLWNGAVGEASENSSDILAPGLWAMLMAAVAVSVGSAPREFFALLNSVLQAPEPGPLELTQAARMSARVLISAWGTALPR